jgi:glucokinase
MKPSFILGIDIGGTNTCYGIVDRNGNMIDKGSLPTTGHGAVEEFVAALKKEILPVIEKVGLENIAGVGIGAPNGNYYTGEIIFAPNLPWQGIIIPMAQLIGDALGLKAALTNDANAAALGEMIYGAAKGMKDFIMVTLGTGLGSGFVANGQLIYGHDGLAGELGHVIAVRDGRMCNCGRYGCLERYASATGLVITAELWLAERDDVTILRSYDGKLTARKIQDAAKGGDAFALALYEYTGKILGQTLADVVAITSPQAIIFFGGLARAGDTLLDPVKRHMENNMLNVYKNKVQLLQSALPDADAAILGASALAW